MTRFSLVVTGATALATIFVLAPASAFVRCTTSDGKTMFVDIPPPGCQVEGEYRNRPGSASEDAPAATTAVSASTRSAPANDATQRAFERRKIIEREAQDAAARRLAALNERTTIVYPPPPSGGTPAELEAHRAAVAEIGANRQRLEREIEELVGRISRYREEFAGLSREVVTANQGAMPPSWPIAFDCPGCP